MASASGVNINFLSLQNQIVEATVWRQRIAPTEAKPRDALCYTLPEGDDPDKRKSYLISLNPEAGYEAWQFGDRQNRQLALRYIFEVLAAGAEKRFAGDCKVHRGFQRGVSIVIKRTPHGNQEIWMEPYFLVAKGEFGFLIDFHFWKKPEATSFREVQRLSLGLDEHYRSNRNAYIDREKIIGNFINGPLASFLPIHHPHASGPLNVNRRLTAVDVEQLKSKVFVLADEKQDDSQWKGLERYGPLEKIREKPNGCIMLFQNEHRPLAEDLYRGLTGKASGVAFKGMPTVFGLTFDKYFSVVPQRWTLQELEAAVAQIARIKLENPGMNLIVVMVEDIENSEIYFEAKYRLLNLAIPMQVVSAQLIQRRDQFKWSVSNIALQIFTKLGGIPWKVKPAYDNCLIIGIGQAHRLGVAGIQKYFAYCVATDSSGLYKKIAVLSHTNSRSTYIDELQRSLIREMLATGSSGYTHCVLHVPFKLKHDELQALEKAVQSASATAELVKFAVLKINDDHRFFGYAVNNSRVPIEGTIARLGSTSMLLWFEGLKSPTDVVSKRIAGPVHLEFLWPKTEPDFKEQNRYLQDLFNLSGTNWRGFNARSTPISTYYCRLIAKFLAAFPDQLPRIEATGHPWFL